MTVKVTVFLAMQTCAVVQCTLDYTSRWPFTADARVQFRTSPHRVCGGLCGTGRCFSPNAYNLPCHSIMSLMLHVILRPCHQWCIILPDDCVVLNNALKNLFWRNCCPILWHDIREHCRIMFGRDIAFHLRVFCQNSISSEYIICFHQAGSVLWPHETKPS
jgi:hypothetical protein